MTPKRNDPTIWSRQFALDIARVLGLLSDGFPASQLAPLIGELTETFRYLPPAQLNATENYARFLRAGLSDGGDARTALEQSLRALHEVSDLAGFLRARHGYPLPADESDEWSDEDRQDITKAALLRIEANEESKDASTR